MRTVEEHLAQVLRTVSPLGALEFGLLDAHGCVLAEDVRAPHPLPGFDNSAMDGYALRSADAQSVPVSLPVTGDIAAGPASALTVTAGRCVRIMTGAMVPHGADTVVPVEQTDGGVTEARIDRVPAPGDHIRRAGEDVAAGETVLTAGTTVGAAQLGLAAAVGRARLVVRPRPRVVVLSTGSELVEPGGTLGPGQIFDANSLSLTAAVVEAGGIGYRVGIVPDDPQLLLDTLEDQLVRADAIVTSGGVSVGAYDVVKEVLSRLGTVEFTKVAMQPGMPQGFGTIGPDAIPVFGLPGNPVSALVSFEAFVRPALRRMLGVQQTARPTVTATCPVELTSPAGRRSFLRVRVDPGGDGYLARPVSGAGSHLLAGMARANGLAVIAEDVQRIPAGAPLQVSLLERRSG